MWMADPARVTLEDVLRAWVDDSTPMPGTVERLDEKLDQTSDDEPWVVLYTQEALRATVHGNSGHRIRADSTGRSFCRL